METLIIDKNSDKASRYRQILPQIEAVLSGEEDLVANLANVSAILKEAFGFWWVGFYLVKPDPGEQEVLVLGPFQGPLACTRIGKGRGVCGTAWKEDRTVVVKDVEQFPGHIACSSLSRSEVVVPMRVGTKIVGVLDIDSEELAKFDEIDAEFLTLVCEAICKNIK